MGVRVQNIVFLAALAAVFVFFYRNGPWWLPVGFAPDSGQMLIRQGDVEEGVPFGRQLRQLGLDLRLAGGRREQNGIFISDEGLMRNLDRPVELYVQSNTEALREFSQLLHDTSNRTVRTYLALVPTSGGVLQQNLPRYAQSRMVNQQRLIEELYSGVSGAQVNTVDVYSALYSRRGQYIYYRTENNLTALGGYYTYTALARRLGLSTRPLSRYWVEYMPGEYYGDLYGGGGAASVEGYDTAPYRNVTPDRLALYHYTGERAYTVTHTYGDKTKTYHTLYPTHLWELGGGLDIYLGGGAARLDIASSSRNDRSILIFGDRTAAAYLPFLASHYQDITFVNLFLLPGEKLDLLRPEAYDEVLFCYGIDTYIHSNQPAAVSRIAWDDFR